MKKLLILIFLVCAASQAQIRIGNTDRQKIDSLALVNDTLQIRIENDVLRKLDLSTLQGGGGEGDFQADGSVPMTGDFDGGGNDVLNVETFEVENGVGTNTLEFRFEAASDIVAGIYPIGGTNPALTFSWATGFWNVPYDNSASGLSAITTQAAIDEVAANSGDNLGSDGDRGDFTVASGNATIDAGVITPTKVALDGGGNLSAVGSVPIIESGGFSESTPREVVEAGYGVVSDSTIVANGKQVKQLVMAPLTDILALVDPDPNYVFLPIGATAYGYANILPPFVFETTPATTFVADLDAVGVLNVPGATTGAYYVEIPVDATYEHPIGTVLHFRNTDPATSIQITYESGVTGPTMGVTADQVNFSAGYVSLIKTDDDQWEIFDNRGNDITYDYPQITISNTTDAITTGDGAGYWTAPQDGYIITGKANTFVSMDAVTSGTISVEINKNDSDISTTEITTDSGALNSIAATTGFVLTSYTFSKGDRFRFDITTAPTGGYVGLVNLKVHYFD